MAIQTGLLRKRKAQKSAAKSIADALAAQRSKEGKFSGLMSILSPLAGIAMKGGMAALSIGSGGVLSPLLMGAGTSLLKKWTEEGLRKAGLGADTSEIKADSKYGLGKEEAAAYRESMKEGIKERGWSPESLAMDVGMSYASALMPKIGVDPETGKIGVEGGDLGKSISEAWEGGEMKELLTTKEGLLGMESGIPTIPTVPVAEDIEFDMPWEDADIGETDLDSLYATSDQWESPIPEVQGPPEAPSYWDTHAGFGAKRTPESKEWQKMKFNEGGRVPKYYGGGRVQDNPTISDYFNIRGATLGGSNKQSLAEILGRK
tara:strand:+ start:37 stop:990 length:954 start_codon:yes stop_codon:yes gene_type:complete